MHVHVAPDLREVVRLGVLTFDGASNRVGDTRLDAPLAASERAVRDAPPEESRAVRAMYRAESTGELYLCRHCGNRLEPALHARGWTMSPVSRAPA